MTIRRVVASSVLGFALSASAATSTPLLKTTTTWDGNEIRYVATQRPEVDAVVVEIAPNAATPVHLHPVNNYAYVLDGEVTVEMGDMVDGVLRVKKSATFKKGEAFAELVDAWHQGKAGPQGVKILVWYTAEVGRPFTVAYGPNRQIAPGRDGGPRPEPARDSENPRR